MVLFSNGQGPQELPQLKLDHLIINFTQEVKFLGVILTTKLNWKKHIDSKSKHTRG